MHNNNDKHIRGNFNHQVNLTYTSGKLQKHAKVEKSMLFITDKYKLNILALVVYNIINMDKNFTNFM